MFTNMRKCMHNAPQSTLYLLKFTKQSETISSKLLKKFKKKM